MPVVHAGVTFCLCGLVCPPGPLAGITPSYKITTFARLSVMTPILDDLATSFLGLPRLLVSKSPFLAPDSLD